MSADEHPGPPDPDLESFYAAERARPGVADAQKHAALARVLAATAAAPVGAPPPPPVAPGVSTSAAVAIGTTALLLGVAIGAVGHAFLAPPPSPHAPELPAEGSAIEAPEVLAPPTVAPEPETVLALEPSPEPVPEPLPEPLPEAEERPRTEPGHADEPGIDAEMTLVARAQTALHRGLYDSALDALAEHARRFPRGEMAEEREALAVQALARAGRTEEARARAARFDARYPRSVLGPVVHAAIESAP